MEAKKFLGIGRMFDWEICYAIILEQKLLTDARNDMQLSRLKWKNRSGITATLPLLPPIEENEGRDFALESLTWDTVAFLNRQNCAAFIECCEHKVPLTTAHLLEHTAWPLQLKWETLQAIRRKDLQRLRTCAKELVQLHQKASTPPQGRAETEEGINGELVKQPTPTQATLLLL